jgi:hypothetical protein
VSCSWMGLRFGGGVGGVANWFCLTVEAVGDTRTTRVRWEPQEEGVMRTAASFPSV